jgi:SAM-dependent methyltransferase
VCDSSNFLEFLDLGYSPPADQFLRKEQLDEPETFYPLNVQICQTCNLVQLGQTVHHEILYRNDYPYESSTTKQGKLHWEEFAKTTVKEFSLTTEDLVVDIGSNVGVLLEAFNKHGPQILGVDPASNIVKIANDRGIETWDAFFDLSIAEKILSIKGPAKIVTGTNVFAHINDLHSFMKAVKTLLTKDGIFIFEAPYLGNLIRLLEYDTIYHEHLSYLSLSPIKLLASQFGMEVIDVQERDIHGGSFRVLISRIGVQKIKKRVKDFEQKENSLKLTDTSHLKEFAHQVEQNKKNLLNLLHDLKRSGKKITAVSTPAKGMTLLNYCKIGTEILDFATEKSLLKIGKYTPGMHIPIKPDKALIEEKVDYALLLAWNFADEIMENLTEFKQAGGKFIIPIPEPRIV